MAENRRGTERRIVAADRRLYKAADVPKDEVGQGVFVAAADAEATTPPLPAMRPHALFFSRFSRRWWSASVPWRSSVIRDVGVANACTARGSARARGECHSSRHGEAIADDLKVWRGGKKIAHKAGVGFSCFAARCRTHTHAQTHTYAREGGGILLIVKRKRRCCCCCCRASRQF